MCSGEQMKICKEEGGRNKEGKLSVIHYQHQYKSKGVPVLMKHYHDDVWAVETGLLHQVFLTSALVGVNR
jgi:hypothetical protein